MGVFDPSPKELSLISDFHLEAGKLLGTEVKIKFIDDRELDLYNDPNYDFESDMSLYIILDQRPRIRILEKLGWYDEDQDDLPMLAYFAKENLEGVDIKPVRGVQLLFEYSLEGEDQRLFEITKSHAQMPGPLYWVCALVPVRDKFSMESDIDEDFEHVQDGNYEMLKIEG